MAAKPGCVAPAAQPPYCPALSLSYRALRLLLAAAILLLGLLREGGRAMTVLALISICLGKEPDSSVELRGEHILVWSTGRRLEEIMTLCSCTNAQLKLQGSCRALPLVVVLGQDSYRGKSLGRKGNSFT